MNYSVFQYEVLSNSDKACKVARTAFEEAGAPSEMAPALGAFAVAFALAIMRTAEAAVATFRVACKAGATFGGTGVASKVGSPPSALGAFAAAFALAIMLIAEAAFATFLVACRADAAFGVAVGASEVGPVLGGLSAASTGQ